MDNRVEVSNTEYETHLAVALRTLPSHVWARYVAFEKKRLEKRDTEADHIDPRDELARHLAGKLDQAKWTITREKKQGGLFG
jgi:hypothetical protein